MPACTHARTQAHMPTMPTATHPHPPWNTEWRMASESVVSLVRCIAPCIDDKTKMTTISNDDTINWRHISREGWVKMYLLFSEWIFRALCVSFVCVFYVCACFVLMCVLMCVLPPQQPKPHRTHWNTNRHNQFPRGFEAVVVMVMVIVLVIMICWCWWYW